ncbi:XP_029655223.1myophilin [Octopus vulgaris]|uniref:Transgelin n=1 Tax=Octopus vulgaris TaxID=6645 RepID=A0AA36BNM5_OCTVU|nr:XP_029655223.1myophilin [Octopus vulgaris]
MNNRAKKCGISADVQAKVDSKYDEALASEGLQWIHDVLEKHGDPQEFDVSGNRANFESVLSDGYLLAKLISVLNPGSISPNKLSKRPTMTFKKMELIEMFLSNIKTYGVPDHELFATIDLTEAQNLNQVVVCLQGLGRKARANGEIGFGPQESQANVRTFTEEQLNAGNSVISLQYGSNKGASQAGMSFGKSRKILD